MSDWMRVRPRFTTRTFGRVVLHKPFGHQADREHFAEGYRKAKLPEEDPDSGTRVEEAASGAHRDRLTEQASVALSALRCAWRPGLRGKCLVGEGD